MTAIELQENEAGCFPLGRIARVECESKEGTRKLITGMDGHTVHGGVLRIRRLLETVTGHGKFVFLSYRRFSQRTISACTQRGDGGGEVAIVISWRSLTPRTNWTVAEASGVVMACVFM